MACENRAPLPDAVATRIERVLSISGIHDLRPLLLSEMNAALRLDDGEATAESPARLDPRPIRAPRRRRREPNAPN
jgi:arylformamidase